MKKDNEKVPEDIKKWLRTMWLEDFDRIPTLDIYELELFEWYVNETENVIVEMLSAERTYIQEQIDIGVDDINDSGIVAAEYYLKRVRYSHVIYMTSLLENFLERSCANLTNIIGQQNLPFSIKDLKGDQWSVKKKFIEKYGKFSIPENLWGEIKALTLLRNNIVHDNGYISELKHDDKAHLEKQRSINLKGCEVVIEVEYIHDAFKAIKSLVKFVEARLGEIADRAIRPRII
jgi:hypothetical protein